MKRLVLSCFVIAALLLSACGEVATEAFVMPTATKVRTSTQPPTETVIPIITETIQPSSTSSVWKAVRDERFGFGLALPCWWLVDPIIPGGIGGVMIVKNYDEAYFNANSTKGYWEWPNGSLKLDIYVTEGADPALSDAEAHMAFADPSLEEVVSSEVQQTGAHTATILTLRNLINTNDPDFKVFVYRLAPDKLITVAPIPQSIINTSDIHAILSSIVLSPDEEITLPTIIPAPALINSSCAQ